jgi:DNA-directed RNA polymerase specialized sigma subunit
VAWLTQTRFRAASSAYRGHGPQEQDVTAEEPMDSAEEAIEDLTEQLGRPPRPTEISQQMDIELDEVIEAIAEHREPRPDQDEPDRKSDPRS